MTSLAPRSSDTPRVAYSADDRQAAYLLYAQMERPSVARVAEMTGIPARTLERWCAEEGWIARRSKDALDRVAATSHAMDTILLRNAERLMHRALDLAFQDDDLPTAARMTTLGLGLLGRVPVSKSASVVQHLSGSDASATSGTDQRSVLDIAAALNDRLAALGGVSHPPSPPEEINETNERTMTGGVPLTGASAPSYPDSDSPSPDGDEGADGVIDAEWSDGAVPEEE